jgi:hypothetical protein
MTAGSPGLATAFDIALIVARAWFLAIAGSPQ